MRTGTDPIQPHCSVHLEVEKSIAGRCRDSRLSRILSSKRGGKECREPSDIVNSRRVSGGEVLVEFRHGPRSVPGMIGCVEFPFAHRAIRVLSRAAVHPT